jgi:hypothetical protein
MIAISLPRSSTSMALRYYGPQSELHADMSRQLLLG